MSAGNALEGVRVLVAEDEALIALDLETTLRGLGEAVWDGPSTLTGARHPVKAVQEPSV